MKILVIGNGYIGTMIREYLKGAGYKERLADITSATLKPFDVVVNTAAKTDIDWCEKNKIETFKSNVEGAVHVAELCAKGGKKYVFISSACIFDSLEPKDEYDQPTPACFYTETKVMAERLIEAVNPTSLILRFRMPVSETPHPRNTLNKILSYPKLHNNQNSFTILEDMFPVMKELIENREKGVFHLVNEGTISPSEIAVMVGKDHEVFSKEEESQMFKDQKRAKKVDSIIKSTRIGYLPKIKQRLKEIVEK
jgi:dTDP-4-dehydrorhamnose reductase